MRNVYISYIGYIGISNVNYPYLFIRNQNYPEKFND